MGRKRFIKKLMALDVPRNEVQRGVEQLRKQSQISYELMWGFVRKIVKDTLSVTWEALHREIVNYNFNAQIQKLSEETTHQMAEKIREMSLAVAASIDRFEEAALMYGV